MKVAAAMSHHTTSKTSKQSSTNIGSENGVQYSAVGQDVRDGIGEALVSDRGGSLSVKTFDGNAVLDSPASKEVGKSCEETWCSFYRNRAALTFQVPNDDHRKNQHGK